MTLVEYSSRFLNQGIREVAGPSSHPQILSWLRRTERLYPTDIPIDDSRYAWCGVFVGCCVLDLIAIGEKLPKPPSYFQGAKRWLEYGKQSTKTKANDIVVLRRPGGYHVAIVESFSKGSVNVIGGNQSDSVCRRSFPENLIVGVRTP